VSSLSRAPRNVDVPSAKAAQTNARLVMLFDPGGRTRARSGPAIGWMAISAGKAVNFGLGIWDNGALRLPLL
jgi:hypothetical protein